MSGNGTPTISVEDQATAQIGKPSAGLIDETLVTMRRWKLVVLVVASIFSAGAGTTGVVMGVKTTTRVENDHAAIQVLQEQVPADKAALDSRDDMILQELNTYHTEDEANFGAILQLLKAH